MRPIEVVKIYEILISDDYYNFKSLKYSRENDKEANRKWRREQQMSIWKINDECKKVLTYHFYPESLL